MKLALYIIGIFVILSGCKKGDDQPTYSYENSSYMVKYVFKLSNDTIVNYSRYDNGQLVFTFYFFFQDTIVKTVEKDGANKIISRGTYKIGNNGFAESLIDTAFSDSGTFVSHSYSTFQYDNNGYLINEVDSGQNGIFTLAQTIDNGNISSWHISVGCTDYYTYNGLTSSVDVENFFNKITGKSNRNLIQHASLDNGCPTGPSSYPPEADYQYEFNGNNYLTKQTTIYTPSYHTGTGNVTRIVSAITYEYN